MAPVSPMKLWKDRLPGKRYIKSRVITDGNARCNHCGKLATKYLNIIHAQIHSDKDWHGVKASYCLRCVHELSILFEGYNG